MKRIALGIEYDGAPFHGWQKQGNTSTVQLAVEQALSRVAATPIAVICAGRTDTGVHATGQVVHFDSPVMRDHRAWIEGSNSYLPQGIQVQWAESVSSDFHARFSAVSRTYRYWLYAHPRRPGLLQGNVGYCDMELTIENMCAAAQFLIGEHDFSSFRSGQCQAKSPIRTLYQLEIVQHDHIFLFTVKANAFLHHMVRRMIAMLIEIGSGKRAVEWAKAVLQQRDYNCVNQLAPASGLYLCEVEYPAHFALPVSKGVWGELTGFSSLLNAAK